ncbi:MAG: hypothetical protein AB1413_12455 [Thermodesulfobacteriota bacterium]
MDSPCFCFRTDNPLDMLDHAGDVCRFLADVSPAFSQDGAQVGLTGKSANGLCLILLAVEATIAEASRRLD